MSAPSNRFPAILAAVALAAAGLIFDGHPASAIQGAGIDGDDIGGAVSSPNGPEAGVWVIAETGDFATRFRKIVVTDDEGRYVLPDLPDARYDVWVRGYGLADSPKVAGRPGQTLDLTAVIAATPRDAAAVYPANYWYSLMQVPDRAEFPGTGADGNGIPPSVRTQAHWVDLLKQGCQLCHQLGNLATREIPNPEDFDSTEAAWAHRIMTGQRASNMGATINRFGARPRGGGLRGLDRPDHGGRGAGAAAAAAGAGTRRRADDVGVGRRNRLHPRRDRERQARPARQRRRSGLRRRVRQRQARLGGPDHERSPRSGAAGPRHPGARATTAPTSPRRYRTPPTTSATSCSGTTPGTRTTR